ncbi:pimeloyl-ACP methyl ester carboxylesterase [Bradyrhizobium sp. USDA 326]|uniref:alpha/beta fold hydrolase n=1 Tax=unclassified Bradyrhizobium TaxID=2631580 RepID=UPI0035124592
MALVLVPGFMADKELWAPLAKELEEFGPIVHADISMDDSIPDMARRAIVEAPERFALIGFSLGGYVAREIARLAPDKVDALVLVATSSRADTTDQARRKALAASLPAHPFKGVSRSSIEASLHPSRACDSDLVSRIRAMGVRLGHDAFVRQSGLIRESDFRRLGEIRCPTLIVAGEQDRIRNLDEALELNIGIRNSTVQIVRESGHMIPMEKPAKLATLVKSFLHKVLRDALASYARSS